jgi:sulfatase maturation enzyme AslB (radical SAM superfamily)
MESKRKSVILQVTENCNLQCIYCYQTHNQEGCADLQTLISIITRELDTHDAFDEVEFDFIGGEPLLEFDLIRNTCERVWNNDFTKPYIFFATTNGTLLTPEMKKWFTTHRQQFWLGLSIDGTKQMHDLNRCNSYSNIDIDFFRENWPDQTIKMTISPLTLSNLAEGIIELTQKGFKVAANLAYGVDWNHKDYPDIFGRELEKLANYYLENSGKEPVMLMDMPLYKVARKEVSQYCGTGSGMVAYNTTGLKFPCQMFYTITFDDNLIWENTSFDKVHLDYYTNCYEKNIFPVCPMCVGMNLKESGETHKCDRYLCDMMKVLVKANAWFKSKRLKDQNYAEKHAGVLEDTVQALRIIKTL